MAMQVIIDFSQVLACFVLLHLHARNIATDVGSIEVGRNIPPFKELCRGQTPLRTHVDATSQSHL
jgi:hypothetical protein